MPETLATYRADKGPLSSVYAAMSNKAVLMKEGLRPSLSNIVSLSLLSFYSHAWTSISEDSHAWTSMSHATSSYERGPSALFF